MGGQEGATKKDGREAFARGTDGGRKVVAVGARRDQTACSSSWEGEMKARRWGRYAWVLLALAGLALPAARAAEPVEAEAVQPGLRAVDMGPKPAVFGPVLTVPPSLATVSSGANVLLLGADDGAGPLQAGLLGYADIAAVDFYPLNSSLPTLSQLQAYNVVICWTDYTAVDPVAAGNLLADYVDVGGKVVISTFAFYGGSQWALAGRIMTDAYSPLLPGDGSHYSWANLGTYNASHPIMQGITALGDYYRDYTVLSTGATLVASWDDGENLVATKGCIVGIDLYPGPSYDFTGDVIPLYHNTVNFLMGGCAASLYDRSFLDDYGRSRVCVNTKTGDWQYTVLSGLWKGSYTGKSSISKTSDRWTFRSLAGSPRLMLLTYYPQMFRATASLGGSDFVSQLSDRSTKDDPPGCSAK